MTYFAEIAALSYEDREIVAQVMAEAVPLMTDRQQECLGMHLHGMTHVQVGRILGIERSVATRHIAAAIGKVKRVSAGYTHLPFPRL